MKEDHSSLYWRVMDICIDIEEGVKGHAAATTEIFDLMNGRHRKHSKHPKETA